MNPFEMLKSFMGKNIKPEQMIGQIINMNNGNSNPMVNNLIEMARKGNSQGVETFARNMFKEQGRDFDKEFSEFMNKLKS